jgi:hypothetical protein
VAEHPRLDRRTTAFSFSRDLAGAKVLRAITSAFFVSIELGNVCMKRGSLEDALHSYADALQHAPTDPKLRRSIEEQIKNASSEPLDQVPELRNPFLE